MCLETGMLAIFTLESLVMLHPQEGCSHQRNCIQLLKINDTYKFAAFS